MISAELLRSTMSHNRARLRALKTRGKPNLLLSEKIALIRQLRKIGYTAEHVIDGMGREAHRARLETESARTATMTSCKEN